MFMELLWLFGFLVKCVLSVIIFGITLDEIACDPTAKHTLSIAPTIDEIDDEPVSPGIGFLICTILIVGIWIPLSSSIVYLD